MRSPTSPDSDGFSLENACWAVNCDMRMNILWKAFSFVILATTILVAHASSVTVTRTPNEGIQPQVAVDSAGTAHLIYYKGAEGGGDVFYARQKADEDKFSKPIKVNSRPGSAIAAGRFAERSWRLGKIIACM